MPKLTLKESRLGLFLWLMLYLVALPWGFVGIAYVGMWTEVTEIWLVGMMLTKLYLTPPRLLFGLPSPGETWQILPVDPSGYALVALFYSGVAVILTLLLGGWWARRKAHRSDAEFS